MRNFLKFSSVVILVLLAIMALGPENWQPRSGFGWEFDHFAGYFVLTLMFCLAWPRPLVVAVGAATFVTTVVSGLDYVLTYAREAIRATRAAPRAAS